MKNYYKIILLASCVAVFGFTASTVKADVPVINSISPSSTVEDGPAFVLTINGNGFVCPPSSMASVVTYNGTNKTIITTNGACSVTQLNITILTSDITNPGTYIISVFNGGFGGGTANESFTVTAAAPNETLTIIKNITGVSGTFTFSYGIAGTTNPSPINVTTTTDSGSSGPIQISAGTYSITEIMPSDGWFPVFASCNDGTSQGTTGSTITNINIAPGQKVTCTFENNYYPPPPSQGTLQIKKVATGGNATFNFNIPATLIAIAIDTQGDDPDQSSPEPIDAGTYSVTESLPSNWTVVSASCNTSYQWTSGSTTISNINIVAGQDVLCTFTNNYTSATSGQGTLKIIKNVTGGDGVFLYDIFLTQTPNPTTVTIDTSVDRNSQVSLASGTYVITETMPSADWKLVAVACNDGTSQWSAGSNTITNITIGNGQNVVCTLANEYTPPQGTLIISKNPTTFWSGLSFDFFIGPTPVVVAIDENSPIGENSLSKTVSISLDPGTYDVIENIPYGWLLQQVWCTIDNSEVTGTYFGIDLGNGIGQYAGVNGSQDVLIETNKTTRCYFANDNTAYLKVIKNVTGSDGYFPFSYCPLDANCDSTDSSNDIELGAVTTNNGTGSSLITVSQGVEYKITETTDGASFLGFDFVSASCSDGSTNTAGLPEITFNMQPLTQANWGAGSAADLVTTSCTFNNAAEVNSIQVNKIASGGTGVFNFVLTGQSVDGSQSFGPIGFSIDTNSSLSYLLDNLVPGTYSISESVPSGWVLNSASCSGGTNTGTVFTSSGTTGGVDNINVSYAQTPISCTFTNTSSTTSQPTNPRGGVPGETETWGTIDVQGVK